MKNAISNQYQLVTRLKRSVKTNVEVTFLSLKIIYTVLLFWVTKENSVCECKAAWNGWIKALIENKELFMMVKLNVDLIQRPNSNYLAVS